MLLAVADSGGEKWVKQMRTGQEKAREALTQVQKVVLGKRKQVEEIFLAFLADGHVLLEDIPGVGKTTLAKAFARVLGLDYRRIQFTPDVMASDLTGFSVYSREKEEFVYQPGNVFCNLLLADELNRTSPKTQSALLEAMEERQCTAEGITRKVPSPFLVIATQNPFGSAGTWGLPEAQTDRFLIALSMGYPDFESELALIKADRTAGKAEGLPTVLDSGLVLAMQEEVRRIRMGDKAARYLLGLVTATREHPQLCRGAGPRASIALAGMARAAAWMSGRDYVVPEDVKEQFGYVVGHRIVPDTAAGTGYSDRGQIIDEILNQVRIPFV